MWMYICIWAWQQLIKEATNLKETEDGVYGKNKGQKEKGEQYKTIILLSWNTKEKSYNKLYY